MPPSPASPTPEPPARLRAFDDFGYGLFLHWGLYSHFDVGEWYFHHHQTGWERYREAFAKFDARAFDAPALARWAKSVGLRYVCLTARHHEGFSLYDTRGLNTWDAPHSPAGRDLVREYVEAVRAEGLGVFLYHTTLDWWHPEFDRDWDAYLAYLRASVEILCTHYGRIDGLWFDGNWSHRDRDWQEGALYALIRRLQPECVIVNNSSTQARGALGHPEVDVRTFEQGTPDRRQAGAGGRYLSMEQCETVNSHWGIAGDDYSAKSPAELIEALCRCRKVGANLLLNVGPTPGGALPAYERAALEMVGRWIGRQGQSLYRGRPANLTTRGKDFVLDEGGRFYYYQHDLAIKGNSHLSHGRENTQGWRTVAGALPPIAAVRWVDTGEALRFTQDAAQGVLAFDATPNPYGRQAVVRVAELVPA